MANKRIEDVLARLQGSRFRQRFGLGSRERQMVRNRGLAEIARHGERFIADRLAPAQPPNDGRQTPMRGHPIFIAQHATATCCRGCLEKWHNIPSGKALEPPECRYILELLMAWIRRQGGKEGFPEEQTDLFANPD